MKSDSHFDILPLENNEIQSEKYKFSFTSLKKNQRNGCSLVRKNKAVNLYA